MEVLTDLLKLNLICAMHFKDQKKIIQGTNKKHFSEPVDRTGCFSIFV